MENLTSEQVNASSPEATPAQGNNDYAGFADAEALATAYKSLQAEFTRRSQRLKRLEGEIKKSAMPSPDDIGVEQDDRIKPASTNTEDGETEYERFLKQFPDADAEAVVKSAIESGDFKSGGLTRQYVNGLKAEIEALKSENSSEEVLIERAKSSGRVTEAIVREYLSAVAAVNGKAQPRVVGTAPVIPPARPKTIAEAGVLANDIFKFKQ